ncbi:MAG TPA: DUF2059 domain-containing protein [Xanthobacteraceae bacterium]|nr:DUF2059 domain-containing protein [Xanthobacteraceae bacterium]
MNRPTIARALRLAALVIALGITVTGVRAQQPAPKGPPPSAAQIQLARQIIDASGAARAFDGVIPSVMQQAYASFLQQNPDLQKQLVEAITAIRGDFEKRQPEVVSLMATAYASHFTEAELNELLTFYRSPTGKKLVTELPNVLEESFAAVRQWGAKTSEEFIAALRAEMKKRGYTI